MAKYRLEPHPTNVTWAASGTINQELSPKPYTITRMAFVFRGNITTTTETAFNDYWDRTIASLSLTGKGKTFFNFTNTRIAYHLSRFMRIAPRRAGLTGNSATSVLSQHVLVVHFGVAPTKVNPLTGLVEDNPWDLTGGIPPTESGNLTLGGSFGAATAMGTNCTMNSGTMDTYLWGVQPEAGDAPAAFLPRAFPVWQQRTPTPTATSGALATQDNVPAGDFLHSMLVMTTRGSNAPRDDEVLNSIQVFNQLENRAIFTYGGQAGANADYKAAELLSQLYPLQNTGVPFSDDISTLLTQHAGTVGVPNFTGPSDSGLVWLPVHQYARNGNPLYGVDMRGVATGDLQLRYGVNSATTVTMDVLYRRYQLNPDHPANAGA